MKSFQPRLHHCSPLLSNHTGDAPESASLLLRFLASSARVALMMLYPDASVDLTLNTISPSFPDIPTPLLLTLAPNPLHLASSSFHLPSLGRSYCICLILQLRPKRQSKLLSPLITRILGGKFLSNREICLLVIAKNKL